uniref:Predicted nucleotidyltransferase n=1 Tax=Candidatus Kentrum sp. TUN TaxID=2126343 RepID=A0A451A832_9GAMM|nr:MAG: Predicted nucleotidyltransferase [Candidatus Kentron sp. TUN]
MLLDVRSDHLATVREILRRHMPDREVWAFGSRVRGTAREASDLDLCICGDEAIGFERLGRLRDAFSASALPFRVDVVAWAGAGESFRRVVEGERVVVQTSRQLAKWEEFQLGEVCSKIGSGATPRGGSNVYFNKGSVALIRSQNVYNDGFSISGIVFISEQHAASLSNVVVEESDVLLNITGDSVARVCQVSSCILPARVNQHVAIIRTNKKGFIRLKRTWSDEEP